MWKMRQANKDNIKDSDNEEVVPDIQLVGEYYLNS